MNRFPIVLKTLRDYRAPAFWLWFVMVLIAVLDVSIYPSYKTSLANLELPSALSGLLGETKSLSSPAGFLTAEFFSWVPLMLIALAIVSATGATAGEEASGTLEMLLAQPISRRRILLEKTIGLATLLFVVAMLSFPAFLVAKLYVGFDLADGRIAAGLFNMLPITWLFLSLALCAGVLFPSRGSALTAVLGLLIAAYFVYTIGSASNALHPFRLWSPFYWAEGSHVLLHGLSWTRIGAFLGGSAFVLVLAVFAFDRRDIGAHRFGGGMRLDGRPVGFGRKHLRPGDSARSIEER